MGWKISHIQPMGLKCEWWSCEIWSAIVRSIHITRYNASSQETVGNVN
jgi:hypothetical protein